VYNNTSGSLLLVALLHAAQNKSYGIVSVLMPSMTSDQLYVLFILVDGAALLLILAFTRGTLSYKPRQVVQSEGQRLRERGAVADPGRAEPSDAKLH
jgi:hypothetical protein